MVTYRQVGRGMARTIRAMDREAKRLERQRIASEKARQRHALLEASANAAQEYEDTLEALTGAHRVAFRRRDWLTLATEPPPAPTQPGSDREEAARRAESLYRPGWFARTFGFEKRRRAQLAKATVEARAADEADFRNRKAADEAHGVEIAFAQKVVAHQPDALAEALEEHGELERLPFSAKEVEVRFTSEGRLIALVDGLDFDDMPEQSVTLLQSGKASFKALARTRVLELHRDAICSGAVRIALECLKILPLDAVEVIMQSDLLDPGSGHIDRRPVLYLRVATQALEAINLARSEPWPLVERLGGHLDWNKRDGFRAINLAAFNIPTDSTSD